jgi:hypothetical protein
MYNSQFGGQRITQAENVGIGQGKVDDNTVRK